ncbi:hypothetical protein JB92DRAFT_2831369 [Gautieria morchelliformis]|nr:hypothetical protein JB92DRAFT_2831369 [Gautieria morchelliformis]
MPLHGTSKTDYLVPIYLIIKVASSLERPPDGCVSDTCVMLLWQRPGCMWFGFIAALRHQIIWGSPAKLLSSDIGTSPEYLPCKRRNGRLFVSKRMKSMKSGAPTISTESHALFSNIERIKPLYSLLQDLPMEARLPFLIIVFLACRDLIDEGVALPVQFLLGRTPSSPGLMIPG